MKYRFIGGSQHGTFRAVQRDNERVVFPVYNRDFNEAAYYSGGEYGSVSSPRFHEELYERRPLGFGMFAKIHVMALASMGEAEFMRRCADIVEGV